MHTLTCLRSTCRVCSRLRVAVSNCVPTCVTGIRRHSVVPDASYGQSEDSGTAFEPECLSLKHKETAKSDTVGKRRKKLFIGERLCVFTESEELVRRLAKEHGDEGKPSHNYSPLSR